jgi:hypothetical protein
MMNSKNEETIFLEITALLITVVEKSISLL